MSETMFMTRIDGQQHLSKVVSAHFRFELVYNNEVEQLSALNQLHNYDSNPLFGPILFNLICHFLPFNDVDDVWVTQRLQNPAFSFNLTKCSFIWVLKYFDSDPVALII